MLEMLSRSRDVLRVSVSCILLAYAVALILIIRYCTVGLTLFVFHFFNLIYFNFVVCIIVLDIG